jgi:hypothetical protein
VLLDRVVKAFVLDGRQGTAARMPPLLMIHVINATTRLRFSIREGLVRV